jgi:hypothetical protein
MRPLAWICAQEESAIEVGWPVDVGWLAGAGLFKNSNVIRRANNAAIKQVRTTTTIKMICWSRVSLGMLRIAISSWIQISLYSFELALIALSSCDPDCVQML